MREFDIDISKYLLKGIPPRETVQVRSEGLKTCENLIVTPQGLTRRPDIRDLTGDTLTEISGISGPFEVLDFHLFQVAISDASIEEYLYDAGLDTYVNISPVTPSYPLFSTGCAYDNMQAVCAYGNEIYWSKIGMFDFAIDESNEAGRMPVPFSGDILRIKQLGQNVVVFGEAGICMLQPVTDPVPAWKIVRIPKLDRVGLHSYDSVVATSDALIFVGNNYDIYRIEATGQVTQLGYRYMMKDMYDVFLLSYVPLYDAVYISNGIVCYSLTLTGMSSVNHFAPHVIAVPERDETLAGYVIPNVDKDNFALSTLPIDFDMRAAKHIQALEFALETPVLAECSVSWRNSIGPWRTTSWLRLNPQGYVQLPCSGVEFIINLRGLLDENFYLTGAMAKIKYEDKRSLRGRYAG